MDLPPPPHDPTPEYDALPCGYVAFADDGHITAANAVLGAWLGRPRETLVGHHVETILSLPSRIFYQTHFFPLLALHGAAEEVFLALRAHDGADVPVIAHAARTACTDGAGGFTRCVLVRAQQRKQYEDELRHAKRAAEEALANNTALKAAQADLEAQSLELDRQVTRLRQRNDELARLNSILAHDLREPARKLSLLATMLFQENSALLDDTARWGVSRLVAESERLNALLTAVRQYVAPDPKPESFSRVSLDEAVDAALEATHLDTPDGRLTLTRTPLPTVEGHRAGLVTLFHHLFQNAVQYRTPGRPPRVRLSGQVIECNSFRAAQDRYRYVDCARVVFEDDGIGFAPHYAPQLFLALKKLDPHSERIGMGLALCKKVVDYHLGTLEAHGTPGGGARFVIQLPLTQG